MSGDLERERLESIRDQLGRRPWHELSIEEIAGAAGLSRMTLHRRGIGKEDIGAALTDLLQEEYQLAVLPALSSREPAPARLKQALERVCDVDERYLGLLDSLGQQVGEIFHEEGEGEVMTKGVFVDAVRRILDDGEKEGTLDPSPGSDETATLLFNAAGWTYRHMRTGHNWTREHARESVVRLLVAGVSR